MEVTFSLFIYIYILKIKERYKASILIYILHLEVTIDHNVVCIRLDSSEHIHTYVNTSPFPHTHPSTFTWWSHVQNA